MLDVDTAFYNALAEHVAQRSLIDEFVVPIRSGRAWEVPEGHLCRQLTVEGPQVGDLNIWKRHNPRERLWASRTRQLQAAHVTRHDRLWSTLPYLRPLVTITNDTLESYGRDSDGGRVHDMLGTRCDPYVNRILSDEDFDFHCHSNLVRAVLPWGLTKFDVHDVLNVFQCTGLNDEDRYFMKSSPARPGDFFEFFAEQDLLCALSTCPRQAIVHPTVGPGRPRPARSLPADRRPGVPAVSPATDGGSPPSPSAYAGQHGLLAPDGSTG